MLLCGVMDVDWLKHYIYLSNHISMLELIKLNTWRSV